MVSPVALPTWTILFCGPFLLIHPCDSTLPACLSRACRARELVRFAWRHAFREGRTDSGRIPRERAVRWTRNDIAKRTRRILRMPSAIVFCVNAKLPEDVFCWGFRWKCVTVLALVGIWSSVCSGLSRFLFSPALPHPTGCRQWDVDIFVVI